MKSVAVIAGFAAGLAAASHAHHEHGHAHNRRGADGVFTSWDITTEWEYVTVTAGQQGAPTHAAGGQSAASAPAASTPAAAASSAPASSDDVQAAAVTGASDPNAAQASKNAAQASVNAAQASLNSAHQASMQALQAGSTAAGGQATSAAPTSSAVKSSAVASSSAAASSGGSSSGGASGNCVETTMTYYGGEGGLGSCGQPVIDSNPTVALDPSIMSDKSKCFAKIAITVNGATYDATVTDTCPGCTDGHVDAAQDWAKKVAGPDLITNGRVPIKYCWK